MARIIYTLIFYLLLPFILIRGMIRSYRLSKNISRVKERLGFLPFKTRHAIWIHAVSVGETVLAIKLIENLQTIFSGIPIVLTTMTATGSKLAQAAKMENYFHCYVPYDVPFALKNFLKAVRPQLLIIMETELWPNLVYFAAKNSIKIVLANARLSEKSFQGYQKIRFLTQPMLEKFSVIACQSQNDAERFIHLGAKKETVHVTGSIKFDLSVPDDLVKQGRLLRASWEPRRLTWIAASTHENEEEIILAAHREIQKNFPEALLILVPRHPERFREVRRLCKEKDFHLIKRTQGKTVTPEVEIFIGDSLGELYFYYAMADVAFVGGSLVKKGGHNLLEPASLGIPVLSGPNLFNFREISEILLENGVLEIVREKNELAIAVKKYFNDTALRKNKGDRARELVLANRGALGRHLRLVECMSENRQSVLQ